MRSKWYLLLVLACVAACIWLVAACEGDDGDDDDNDDDNDDDDDDDDDDADEYIEEGKRWLQLGEGDRAREAFFKALEIEPDNTDGLYGVVLSDMLHVTDVLSILVAYIEMAFDFHPPEKGDSSQGLLDDLIKTILSEMLIEHCEELVEYSRTCQADPEIEFELDGIPIIINFEQVASLGTEFDQGELHATESYALLFDGLVSHLFVYDLNFDLSYIFMLMDLDFDGMEPLEAAASVVRILLELFTDPSFPNFLTMDTEGIEIYQEAGLNLGHGCNRFLTTFDVIKSETDDQTDDVMAYADLNSNGKYDEGEPFVIPYFDELDDTEMAYLYAIFGIVASLRDSLWDQTEYDVDPANPNPFDLSTLNPLLELTGVPGFIPDSLTLDLGEMYANPEATGLKDSIIAILTVLDLLLPEPPG